MKAGPLFLAGLAARTVAAVTLTVSTTGGNASSPYLYGIMFEDINNSGDGALYGQMLRNNGFQGDNPGIQPFASVGAASITQDNSTTVGKAQHPTVRITAKSRAAAGTVGVSNAGYWGIRGRSRNENSNQAWALATKKVPVYPQTYASYFFIKGRYSGSATVSLVSAKDGTVFGSGTVKVNSNANSFTYYQINFPVTKTAPDGNNLWQITFDNSLVKDGSINVGFPVLYPPTFNSRFNGINNEVGAAISALKPSFLRFPGGNNLEGSSVSDRWIWNNTIGPLEDRPGRQGDWGYPNTDGLGLLEYMQFCQDVGMAPLLAIWDGLTLGGGVTTGSALQPFVQDALNQLEFLLGDSSTTYGAARAALGFKSPFVIPFVEIGNEDFLSSGGDSYPARFMAFYNAIHKAYPNIKFVASTAPQDGSSGVVSNLPAGVIQDVHHYLTPDTFVSMFNEFDNWNRSQPLIVGEYASTTMNNGQQTYWEYVQGSVAEAVYMIGMERNSDVVIGASYAPLLEHFDVAEWSPDLFGYDATNGVTPSTSYFVQQMFSVNRGDTVRRVTSDSNFGPVYWVASSKGSSTYFVKLANYGASQQSVTVKIAGMNSANLTVLTGPAGQANYPGQVNVKPSTSTVTGKQGSFTFTLPAWSVAVLSLRK